MSASVWYGIIFAVITCYINKLNKMKKHLGAIFVSFISHRKLFLCLSPGIYSKSRLLPCFLGILKINSNTFRSSQSEVFLGKGVPNICSKCTGEHPCLLYGGLAPGKTKIPSLFHSFIPSTHSFISSGFCNEQKVLRH